MDLMAYLLDQDADPTHTTKKGLNVLEVAVESKAFDVAKMLTQLDDVEWFFDIMTNEEQDDKTSVLGRMVIKMPSVAVLALNRCVTTQGAIDDPDLKVTYRYDPVDDGKPPNRDRSDNTVLELMIKHQQEDIMNHPVTTRLLDYKWRHFGRLIFYGDFILYVLFLVLTTVYVVNTPVPIFDCASTQSFIMRESSRSCVERVCEGITSDMLCSKSEQEWETFNNLLLVLLCMGRLMLEINGIWVLRLRYFMDPQNYLEVFIYTTSFLIFAYNGLGSALDQKAKWQWDLLAINIFLVWINLLLFVRQVPALGMYVLMFQDVVATFIKGRPHLRRSRPSGSPSLVPRAIPRSG